MSNEQVMNNFKKQGNSIVIQSVNENVNSANFKYKNFKRPSFDGLFFLLQLKYYYV